MHTIRVLGMTLAGVEAELVTVEARFEAADRARTEITLSGLPDAVVREGRGRLAAALEECSLHLPQGRLYLHLAPAGRRKAGEALDLPLALGAAAACGHLGPRALEGTLFLGELSLDGRIRPVAGGLAAAAAARSRGIGRLVANGDTAREAAHLPGIEVLAADTLGQVVGWAAGGRPLPRVKARTEETARPPSAEGLASVRGQAEGKGALAVAAAGGHGLLFLGPPGTGKSLLARALLELLPPPGPEERLEITRIHSAAGRWPGGLAHERPFRAPHHTTSDRGLVGGGTPPRPGEITLAHRGVLFLDELPEFRRATLEALRQPLETGRILISRAMDKLELPADFQLVAAMNPCPCGYRGHPNRPCRCSEREVLRYVQKLSGPLLDRIDLRVAVGVPSVAELAAAATSLDEVEAQVLAVRAARIRSMVRSGVPNADLSPTQLDLVAPLNARAMRLLERAAEGHGLSARAVQSLRRVARTVADLAGEEEVQQAHLAAALGLRAPLG